MAQCQDGAAHATVTAADADLVVLSDNLVADPRMLLDLHSQASRISQCGSATAPAWSAR